MSAVAPPASAPAPPARLLRRAVATRVAVLLIAIALLPAGPARADAPLVVYAPASLTEVIGTLASAWAREDAAASAPPKTVFASSAVLARQIEARARADVFVSADAEWMDYLADRDLLRRESRRDLVSNRLVLIAPADSAATLRIAPGFSLGAALEGGRLALADPDIVPAGRYARAALMMLGAWSGVAERLVRAENVRVALGIVYATDVRAEPRVRVLGTFPEDSHPRILYPAAVLASAAPGAQAFLDFMAGPAGLAIFREAGFLPLDPAPAP
jgi:molybdate transport system substrate-binding protein